MGVLWFCFYKEGDEEAGDEDGACAEYDGEVFMQVYARQIPYSGKGYPRYYNHSQDTAYECPCTADPLRDASQEEETKHASGEYT